MIKNIIFDMGNVILRYDPDAILQKLAENEEYRPLIRKALFDRPEWSMLDRGTMTEPEILTLALAELPEAAHNDAKNVMEHWPEVTPLIDETYHLIRELRDNGYAIYLLSNAGLRFHEYSKNVPAFKLMDGLIVSADYLTIKPEKKIYEILFQKFSLNPSECLFIDDLEANIAGGKSCLMDGIVFDGNMIALRNELLAKGVNIESNTQFSPVQNDDIKTLAALADEIWNQHFIPIIGKPQVDYMLDKFQSIHAITDQINSQGYHYYFLRYDGSIVGYTGYKIEDDALFLSKIYIKEAFRGKKISTKTMELLISIALNNSCKKIWLTVNRDNKNSIAVYKSMGFDILRDQKADIGNGFLMDDHIMQLNL